MAPPIEQLPLSSAELKLAEQVAEREGITVAEATERLISGCFERRTRKKTGKTPARVYSLPKRKKDSSDK